MSPMHTRYRWLIGSGTAIAACLAVPASAQDTPGQPEIVEVWLIDAATDTRVMRLTDYQLLDLAFIPAQLSIEAEADADTVSVRFAIDNVPTPVHNLPPYAIGPDTEGDFEPVPVLRQPGWIRITATPFAGGNASGSAGPTVVRNLYRLQADHVVNSTQDLGDARPGDGQCEALTLVAPGAAAPAVGVVPKAPADSNPDFRAPGSEPPPARHPYRVCTLRAAVEEANATPGRQTISIDGSSGQIYRLTRGQIEIRDGLAIHGHGTPTIDAEHRSRVFRIAGSPTQSLLVDLNDLDLANGDVGTFDRGGNLSVEYGTLQMFGGRIRGGAGNFGGGLYLQNDGHALLSSVIVSGNKAGTPENFGGGGVTQRGGGIFNLGGNLTVRQSAIVDNIAVRGGGLSNYGGLVRIENSSILDNEARSLGGGLENRDNMGSKGRMHLSFSSIVGNRAATSAADPPAQRIGGGFFNAGWAYMASSVIANNTESFADGNPLASPDCHSPVLYDFKSYGNNLVGVLNGNCQFTDANWGGTVGIQHGSSGAPLNPLLTARADSPLPHRVPQAGSPLLDAGGTAAALYPCPDRDVRGRPRPAGAGCDIGSAERQ